MFGSQALETAIGLAVMFFIMATAASSITEFISRLGLVPDQVSAVRVCRVEGAGSGRPGSLLRPTPLRTGLRLSPHPAQASPEGSLAGRSAVPVPSPTCRRWHWAWMRRSLLSSGMPSSRRVR
jgi:hypothetical protein